MLELTKEQMDAIQKAISKKAEESVQEFDKELISISISSKNQSFLMASFFKAACPISFS